VNATLQFVDAGQDFLEWDIEKNVVTGCRPFQGSVWCGTRIINRKIEPGTRLRIATHTGGRPFTLTLNYPVAKVLPLKPAAIPGRKP
jgi:hypothetical protein